MKILLLDIETAPNVAYVWGLWKENVNLERLISSGYVLSWAAKWFGDDDILFDSIQKSRPRNMLRRIHKLLSAADVVVHWNGTSFDIPTLNKEFLLAGMTPPSSYKQIDLITTARRRFRFTSNKLEYVAQHLGVGKKMKHSGFQLWVKCMNKDPEAWLEMEAYNKMDVEILERVYESFRPWIKNHPNVALYHAETDSAVCPACGGSHLQKRGFSLTNSLRYQRYSCSDCGTWSRSRAAIKNSGPVLTTERV